MLAHSIGAALGRITATPSNVSPADSPPARPAGATAVQHECIPQAILGMDVICQAKSGMGKTAVFVISVLQQLEVTSGEVGALVMCHTRELAYQARSRPHTHRFISPTVHPG